MPTDPASLRVLARRAAAKLLGELADAPPADEQITESVRDDFREVLVIVLPVRWAPVVPGVEFLTVKEALAEFLAESPLPQAEPAPARELRPIHTRLLAKLGPEPKTRKTLARDLGLSHRSSHIRQGLADLVRMGLAQKRDGGYSLIS